MKEQQKYQKAKKKVLETPGIRGKNSKQLQRQVTKGENKRYRKLETGDRLSLRQSTGKNRHNIQNYMEPEGNQLQHFKEN